MKDYNLEELDLYYKEIAGAPLLTREEELQFARRIRDSLAHYCAAVLSNAYVLQTAVERLQSVRWGTVVPQSVIEMTAAEAAEKQRVRRLLAGGCRGSKDFCALNRQDFVMAVEPSTLTVAEGDVRAGCSTGVRRRDGSWSNCR